MSLSDSTDLLRTPYNAESYMNLTFNDNPIDLTQPQYERSDKSYKAKKWLKDQMPTKAHGYVAASVAAISVLAGFVMVVSDFVFFGTHTLSSFQSFWQHDWQHVLVATGAAIVVSKLILRMIHKHNEGKSIKLDMLITGLVMGALILGGLYYADHYTGNNVMGGFNEFWTNHFGSVLAYTGFAAAIAAVAFRIFHRVKEKDGSNWSVFKTVMEVAAVTLGLLFTTDALHHTGIMDSFSHFWKVGGPNFAISGLGVAAAYVVSTRLYRNEPGHRDIIKSVAFASLALIGILYGVDAVCHTTVMKPFTEFWKTEWIPMLEAGAVSLGIVGLIAILGRIHKKEDAGFRIFLAMTITFVLIAALARPWGGDNLAELLDKHDWASFVGVSMGVGLGVMAAQYLNKKDVEKVDAAAIRQVEPSQPQPQPARTLDLTARRGSLLAGQATAGSATAAPVVAGGMLDSKHSAPRPNFDEKYS